MAIRFDATEYKIPIFVGVNDNPIAPTAINNANADYFIDRFNKLIDDLDFNKSNTLITTIDYYVSSTNGNDSNDGLTNTTPFLTLNKLNETLEPQQLDSSSVLSIYLEGSFSQLDLRGIYVVSEALPVIINVQTFGTGYSINPTDNDVFVLSSRNSFILNIDSVTLSLTGKCDINTNHNTVIKLSNSTIQINNSSSSLNVANTYFILETANTVINNQGTPAILANNNSIVKIGDFSYDTSNTSSTLLQIISHSKVIITNNYAITEINLSLTNHFATGTDQGFFYIDSETFDVNLIADTESFKYYSSRNNIDLKEQAARYNALTGDDRLLEASAIKNLATETAIGIRDSLESLTGNDRLDASAIKNLTNLIFFTSTTANFTQPAINANVAISVGSTAWMTVGNYLRINGGGTYEVISVNTSTNATIKNLGLIDSAPVSSIINSGATTTLTGKPGFIGYTFTSAIFQQPAIDANVNIELEEADVFNIGSVILVDDTDAFQIISAVNSTTYECKRLGYYTNVAETTNINTGTKVVSWGLKGNTGEGAFTSSTADFTTPAIGATVSVDVNNAEFLETGVTVFIEGAGFYKVTSTVLNPASITVENLGYAVNTAASTLIAFPKRITLAGERGLSAFTNTTADFTMPAVNSTVGVIVEDTSFLQTGVTVSIDGSVFRVSAITDSTNITVENLGYASNVAPTTVITFPALLTFIGEKGDQGDAGTNGANSFTNTSANFTQPAKNANISVSVDNSDAFAQDSYVFVENGGYYQIVNVPDPTTLLLKNLAVIGNVVPTTTVNFPVKVISVGNIANGLSSEVLGFTMPSVGATVVVTTNYDTTFFPTGSYVYIPTAGYFEVTAKTDFTLTIQNNFNSFNAAPTTVISDSIVIQLDRRPTDTVTRTSNSYIQPAIDATVNVDVYDSSLLFNGDIITADNVGHYEVTNVISNVQITIKNLGYGFTGEVAPTTVVPTDTDFKITGARGEIGFNATFTNLNANFTQPAIDANVQITVLDTSWMVAGQALYIEGGGSNYIVVSVDSATLVTVTNKGFENVAPSTSVNSPGLVVPNGLRGINGTSVMITAANFTQPAANATVQITVDRTDHLAVGGIIVGENSGFYEIISIDSSTLVTIENLDYPTANTVAPTTVVNSGEVLGLSGIQGATGFNATFSTLDANFTQPAVLSTVQIQVNDTSWMSPGQYLFIETGGNYELVSVDSGVLITVRNSYTDNTAPSTTINSGVKVSPSGKRGVDGSVSATTSLVLTEQASDQAAQAGALVLFSKTDDQLYYTRPGGTVHEIPVLTTSGFLDNDIYSGTFTIAGNFQFNSTSGAIYEFRGDGGSNPASLELRCETNTHAVTLKSPPHSAAANYTFEFPDNMGTNGQVLTTNGTNKASWVNPGSVSPLTTKGDLYTYDTDNARLPVGTNGQVLTANSATATGLEWTNASGGGHTIQEDGTNLTQRANLNFQIGLEATDDVGNDASNVNLKIDNITQESTIDGANDLLVIYDASAGALRTVIPDDLGTGGGSALTIEDNGTPLTTNASKLNFVGNVTLTEPVADEITVNIANGLGGVTNDLQTYVGATTSIADQASEDITITAEKSLILGRIETDVEATVRLYSSIAARTADTRALGIQPSGLIEGLITEVQTTTGNLIIDLSSAVGFVNLENPQQSEIYAKVFNESGGNSIVTVSVYAHVVGTSLIGVNSLVVNTSLTADENKTVDVGSFPIAGITYKAVSDSPVRVRLYNSATYRTADLGRPTGTAITGDHGMYFEFVLDSGNSNTRLLAPPANFFSDGTGYFTITELTSSAQTVNITLTITKLA